MCGCVCVCVCVCLCVLDQESCLLMKTYNVVSAFDFFINKRRKGKHNIN